MFCSTPNADSNTIASKVQMHSTSHNVSYYKYGKDGSKCYFNFPRPLVEEIYVDKCNSLNFKQNNMYINLWNLLIALLLQFNYNITFIDFANNVLVLIYYIINYATKRDASQYQRIMSVAFVENAYHQLQTTNGTTNINSIVRVSNIFALKVFNRLAYN